MEWRSSGAAQTAFVQLHDACGLINLDPFQFISGDQTAYELSRRVYWAKAPDVYQTHLRGVFWGNLLSPKHVVGLGGIERVRREPHVRPGDHPARVSATQLDTLTRYLAPLLP